MNNSSLTKLLAARQGHFKLESGHHGDLWLDLDPLFTRPGDLQPFLAKLAERLARHSIDAVCGPLAGGAFLAQMVAVKMGVEFYYAERIEHPSREGLYPVEYRIPRSLRSRIAGKGIALVDDVINAGSAIRATLADLELCGAKPLAIGALLTLQDTAQNFAAARNLPLESLENLPSNLWLPEDCPLCAAHVPLDDVSASV